MQKSQNSNRNLNISENVSKVQGMVKGVIAHLPRHKTHNIKPTDGGYNHLEGFWDWSIYSWSKALLVLSTWVE